MSTSKKGNRYDEKFQKTLVGLCNSGIKSQVALSKEYGISYNALSRWIKLYSPVKTDDGELVTAKEIKELRKRNTQWHVRIICIRSLTKIPPM